MVLLLLMAGHHSAKLNSARNFSEYEDQTAAPVIVVGEKVYSTIFPNGDGIGKYIRIKGRSLKVIGVIKKQGRH